MSESKLEERTPTSPIANTDIKQPTERPYSVYTSKEKWFIATLVSFAGIFSPLTANIYFPAIPTIAAAFHKSTELINLTVTMYMLLQGLSPMFFGSFADFHGRRPVFVLCLFVLCLSCVGLALVPTRAYWLLMVLRCLQATGSASTIALGAGVIGDIAVPAERGGFFGFYSLGPMLGPALGPVIGGALSDGLGWRSIFWFLCIATGIACIVMLLFLPETLRQIVGDGSIVPSPIYRPWIHIIRRQSDVATDYYKPPKRKFRNPLLLFKNLDIVMLLLFNGIVYSVFYAVTASISSLFAEIYPFLNDTTIGICYLAIGLGTAVGSAGTGKVLDWDFQRAKKAYVQTHGSESMKTASGDLRDDFPIEKARLLSMSYATIILAATGMGYGWCLQKKVHIAAPLILQFIIGALSMSVMNPTQTLILDLVPGQGSSVTACNNIVRCLLGAVAVSVIDIILNNLRPGFTYVLLNGIIIISIPLIYFVIKLGPRFRKKRREAAAKTVVAYS
ncbi:MFS general substrate transporter [Lentinula guzmanii]|uniref:MFS general substrate transporter n=1 Tax=Lentinula guzmanii TaxID=2804957 RepID=A0AA38JKP2_9AGAR|nr:MFS general substrate transporter [Lentinula guzmanii]